MLRAGYYGLIFLLLNSQFCELASSRPKPRRAPNGVEVESRAVKSQTEKTRARFQRAILSFGRKPAEKGKEENEVGEESERKKKIDANKEKRDNRNLNNKDENKTKKPMNPPKPLPKFNDYRRLIKVSRHPTFEASHDDYKKLKDRKMIRFTAATVPGVVWTSSVRDYEFDERECMGNHYDRVRVCFARHKLNGVACVLKMTPISDKDLCVQILNEIRVLSQITTPSDYLMKFYHVFVDKVVNAFGTMEDGLYFVTEYLNGRSLAHRIRRKRFDETSLRPLVKNLVTGIRTLHDHGYFHRDLKPDNIVLHTDPLTNVRRAVVIDTGLAKRLIKSDKLQEGSAATPYYHAPEAIILQKQNTASDWWALGIIIYQALFNEFPCDTVELENNLEDKTDDERIDIVSAFVDRLEQITLFEGKGLTKSGQEFIRALLTVPVYERLGSHARPEEMEWLDDEIFIRELRQLNER